MESGESLERAVKGRESSGNEQRLPHDQQPQGDTASLNVDVDLT